MDLARREVKNVIASLPSDASFNVIAYNDFVMSWEDRLQPATPSNKQRSQAFLDDLFPFGATNIYDSLEQAFRISAPGTKDKYYDQSADTILFLSDGGPTAGRTSEPEEILAAVRDWNKVKKVVVHVIGIGKQIYKPLLTQLAEQNGGEFRLID
jgi:Mg-chelatase subunit ChlD